MRFAIVVLAAAACGGVEGLGQVEADASVAPSAFALQFTGAYQGASALELRRDGTWAQEGRVQGRYSVPPQLRALPLRFTLKRRGHAATFADVNAYDGKLQFADGALVLQRPPASDEELCDATRGRWTDDDADPATGLYCVCPPPSVFIPASGGCVE